MNQWDDYRIALALYRSGSIRAAAQMLDVNHATVSRRVASLNTRMGGLAFERVEGEYRPTRLGIPLVTAALQMEESVFEAERVAMGSELEMAGPLVLSLPDVVAQHLLMNEIGQFQNLYPDIRLTVKTSLSFSNLDQRQADVVVRISNNPADHLVGRRLFKYARSYYAAPDYLAKFDLACDAHKMRWLGWAGDTERPEWVAQSISPDTPIGLKIENPLVRHAAAIAGLGLIYDTCFIADRQTGLVRLPGAVPIPDRDIWVLTHPDLKETPRVSTLMRFLSEAISGKRSLIEGF